MRLDPTSLALFVSVVEEGSIAAAARREHIAAAAVSTRIRELEEAVGTSLLYRTNTGVAPTAPGLTFLGLARGVLRAMDEASAQMRDFATGARGHVRVYANISAITQFLPRELHAFLGKYPRIQIQLQEHISSVITKAVAENEADVGIFTAGAYGEGLETFPYHRDRLVVITPPRHPLARRRSVSFAEVPRFDLVGLHTGSAIQLELLKAASELGQTLRVRIQVTSYDALCQMVGAGLGIGVLPHAAAAPLLAPLRLRSMALDEPWAARELRICVRSFQALPVGARLFVEHLRSSPG